MSEQSFFELQQKLFSAFGQGDFETVQLLIQKARNQFPDRLEKILFWEACMHSRQKNLNEAISSLNEGLKKGIWWSPHTLTRDPDLLPLQGLPTFNKILEECGKILASNQKSSKAQLFTYGNQQSNVCIFSLHWRGSSATDFAPFWLDEQRLNQYYFGFAQSSQIYGYQSYCWDQKEIAIQDAKELFKEFHIHGNQSILSGASQGGKLALELCLSNQLGVNKFITVVPSITEINQILSIVKENPNPQIRGCIITGDKDFYYQKTLKLKPIFEEYGINCKFIVVEGLGHFFPNEFPAILSEAVEHVLNPSMETL